MKQSHKDTMMTTKQEETCPASLPTFTVVFVVLLTASDVQKGKSNNPIDIY